MRNLTNSLLARWEWPRLEHADGWWGEFANAQCFTPDDQVRLSTSGWPTFVDLNIVSDGKGGHRTEIAGAEHIVPKGPLQKLTIPVDLMGLVIYDLTNVGGQTRFLVSLTHGTADLMPDAFLLTDPILPTIRADELAAMHEATAMIALGAQSEPDALIGSEMEENEADRLAAPNRQLVPPSLETESRSIPPRPSPRSTRRENDGPRKPSPGSRALTAALDLKKEGLPVSVKAACERAGVDRKNVTRRYPPIAKAIREMASPDRTPRGATWDRRTGRLDAVDEADD
jgi:hypothetical protein